MSELDEIQKKVDKRETFNSVNNPEELAEFVLDDTAIYYDRNKNWFFFNEKEFKWEIVDEVDIIGFIKKKFNVFSLSETFVRSKMLNALKDEARMRKPQDIEEYQVQIGRYIYDIRNDTCYEANKDVLSKIIIPHNISSVSNKEECPTIDKLFTQWVGDEKETLYDIIAYCMSPKHFFDICFWVIGNGENGKGLFQTILHNIIGENNITTQDLELLSDPKDRFTKGFMLNKLICSLGDGNYGTLKHTKALKTLSGCTDPIRAEIKGGNQINFFNKAKLVGAFNTLPETTDKTMGFYRRQHMTEFKNSFCGQKNPLPSVPEREYTVLTKKCFDRLKIIYEDNSIKGWGSKEERKEKYERLSNPIGIFLKECASEDYDSYIFPKVLYNYYTRWAITNGFNTFRQPEFEARLLNQGFEKKRKDVYHYTNMCWGKEKNIPEEIKAEMLLTNQKGYLEREKMTVWYHIKIKIDVLDTIDTKSELDPYNKSSNPKKVSIVSKTSISDFVGEKVVSIEEILQKFGKEAEKQINELLEEGELFTPFKGKVARL